MFIGQLTKARRLRLQAALAATVALTALPAQGQAISISPVASGTPTTQLTRNSDTIASGFAISNNTPTSSQLKIVVRRFHHAGGEPCGAGEQHCTLDWHLDGKRLEPGQPVEFTLDPYTSKPISVMGKAGPLGSYDGSFVVGPAATGTTLTPLTHSIRINREDANLGTDALTLGPGGTRTADVGGALTPIKLAIANGSGTAVQVPKVRAQLLKDDGSASFAHDAGLREADCPPKTEWPRPLANKETLDCTIALPEFTAPGLYRLDVNLAGPGIVKAAAAREFSVRYHWACAGIAVLAGAIAGAFFAGWQNSGRRRFLQSADALALKSKYEALAVEVPPNNPAFKSRRIIDDIVRRLADMLEHLRSTSTADHATQIDDITARLPLIHRLAALEKRFMDAGQPAAARDPYDAASAALAATALPPDVANTLEALAAALTAAQAPSSRVAGVAADAPAQVFFEVGNQSPANLRRVVRRIDTAMLCLTVVLVSVIGIVTLWQPHASWGDVSDFLFALFTGFAATSAGTAGLRELTSGYTLGRIAQR